MQNDKLGVGARFTLSVMSDDYVEIILSALSQVPTEGLVIQTDAISTYVAGDEQKIANYLCGVITAVAKTGKHLSVSILWSMGCPGEVGCQTPEGGIFNTAPLVKLSQVGVETSAAWSLYPLHDIRNVGSDNVSDHMKDIYEAIDYAKTKGTYAHSQSYATVLKGDLADVLETIMAGWLITGRHVQHVVTHATLSINSPSQF